eukprot:4855167-Prymnesium_polylepis.1
MTLAVALSPRPAEYRTWSTWSACLREACISHTPHARDRLAAKAYSVSFDFVLATWTVTWSLSDISRLREYRDRDVISILSQPSDL